MALDFHRPYVDALQRKSKALGLTQRVTALHGDMGNLHFEIRFSDYFGGKEYANAREKFIIPNR